MTTEGLCYKDRSGVMDVARPFEVLGRARDPESGNWARYLKWKDPDGRSHTYAVSDGKLHGDPSVLCSELAAQGLGIITSARSKFVDYLNRQNTNVRVSPVTRTAWVETPTGKFFVLRSRTIGATEDETVIFVGAQNPPYAERGSLEEWRDSIGSLTAGHDRAMFAVSTALSSTLADLAGAESGGVHFFGASSTGKTTVAQA